MWVCPSGSVCGIVGLCGCGGCLARIAFAGLCRSGPEPPTTVRRSRSCPSSGRVPFGGSGFCSRFAFGGIGDCGGQRVEDGSEWDQLVQTVSVDSHGVHVERDKVGLEIEDANEDRGFRGRRDQTGRRSMDPDRQDVRQRPTRSISRPYSPWPVARSPSAGGRCRWSGWPSSSAGTWRGGVGCVRQRQAESSARVPHSEDGGWTRPVLVAVIDLPKPNSRWPGGSMADFGSDQLASRAGPSGICPSFSALRYRYRSAATVFEISGSGVIDRPVGPARDLERAPSPVRRPAHGP